MTPEIENVVQELPKLTSVSFTSAVRTRVAGHAAVTGVSGPNAGVLQRER